MNAIRVINLALYHRSVYGIKQEII